MRAIYSMAALSVLEKREMKYDHVFGASAGAMNAAYFVAGQSDDSLSAYLNDINVREFINPWRFWKIVNTDYLVDEIFKRRKPLDIDQLKKSSTTLHIAVTEYQTGNPAFITNHDHDVDLFEALRASAAVPIFYGKKIKIKGKCYIDGGIKQALPIEYAQRIGCTDITVVLTQPISERGKLGTIGKLALKLLLSGYPRAIRDAIINETQSINNSLRLLDGNSSHSARLTIIAPSSPGTLVSFTENMSRSRLNECVAMALSDTALAMVEQ